ncbi:hypothetical protein F4861DRAFT_109514 [Xylaria intraflava]|nr:hypothetical protein F4861DRAFT_109514 [Xylaria intraflava]
MRFHRETRRSLSWRPHGFHLVLGSETCLDLIWARHPRFRNVNMTLRAVAMQPNSPTIEYVLSRQASMLTWVKPFWARTGSVTNRARRTRKGEPAAPNYTPRPRVPARPGFGASSRQLGSKASESRRNLRAASPIRASHSVWGTAYRSTLDYTGFHPSLD